MTNEKFCGLIEAGDFEKAAALLKNLEESEITARIMHFAYHPRYEGDISVLGFLSYMIQQENTEFWHDKLIGLLINSHCYLEGAYTWAFYLAKENAGIRRSEENLDMLLFFNEIPEHLLSDAEAEQIAGEILTSNPQNRNALRILERIHKKQSPAD